MAAALARMTEATPTRHRRRGHLSGRLSGWQAEATRNDQCILDAARAVFLADPGAPIAAVAKHAGVGISALYPPPGPSSANAGTQPIEDRAS